MVDRDRVTSLFLDMCRVNTPARREKVLVDSIQPMLECMGFHCVRDMAHNNTGGDSGNLIATLPATKLDVPSIFFSSHFDTVAPNPDVTIIIDDGLIRTDGTSILGADDKGGMAPIIEAMRAIQEDGTPHGEIQLLLTVSEEIGLLGAHNIDRSLISSRMGFVLDTGPPVGTVVFTAPTQDILDVTITGKPAHAGFEPEKGISAIQVAAHAIEKMRLGRIDAETTANVGIIQGGSATNVVCPEVKLRAEARSRSKEKLASQVQHMVDTLHCAAKDYGAGIEVAINHMYDGYCLPDEDEVVRMALRAGDALGLPTSLRAAGGGSDANVFNAMGLPSCVLGTGMRNIHTHDECIHIDDLIRSAEWCVAIVKTAAAG